MERGRELSPRSLAVGSGLNDLGRRGLKPTRRELDSAWVTDKTDEVFLKREFLAENGGKLPVPVETSESRRVNTSGTDTAWVETGATGIRPMCDC